MEEGHGIVVEGIGDAGSGSAANIHGVAAVMVEFRAEVKSAEAVVAPGGTGFGGGMGGNKLAGGVDGMGQGPGCGCLPRQIRREGRR